VSDFWNEVRNRTNFASEYLQDRNIECPKPEGSFFIFPKFEEINDEKFTESLLKEKGVQVVPGSRFGPMGKSHLRINCATSEERLEKGLSRICEHFLEK
jgi:aspartate/methionine/tyrosine aminotransferase